MRNTFYTFILNREGMSVLPLEENTKSRAESKAWSTVCDNKGIDSYAGIYTKEELTVVVSQLKKAIKKFKQKSCFGHNSIYNPTSSHSLWTEITSETLSKGYEVETDKMWDYYGLQEAEGIITSAEKYTTVEEATSNGFISRIIGSLFTKDSPLPSMASVA